MGMHRIYKVLMLIVFLVLSFYGEEAFAVQSCSVCLDDITAQDVSDLKTITCINNHGTHQECLAHQVDSHEHITDLVATGVECCGENCKDRFHLKKLQEMLDPIARLALDDRIAKAAHVVEERPKTEIQRLAEGIDEAFNLCCPKGCGSGFAQIEGCNAATCSNDKCNATFCYLCLEPQRGRSAAHAHVKRHAGDYWDYRPGYVERYHWLLARKKLGELFERDLTKKVPTKWYHRFLPHRKDAPLKDAPLFENRVDEATQAIVLNSRKSVLEERNMWPMPAGIMSDQWVQQVRDAQLPDQKGIELQNKIKALQRQLSKKNDRITQEKIAILQSELKKRNEPESQKKIEAQSKIELFQNEYIYRRQMKDSKNASVIKAELIRLGAKVLASLDVGDDPDRHAQGAQGAQGAAHAVEPIIPVMEGDPRVPPAFSALGPENMYQVGNLIWSAVPAAPRNGGNHPAAGSMIMDYQAALTFCQELGGGSRLPTREEYEALARSMTVNGRYDHNRIPDMSGNWFWSSSVHPVAPDGAFYFNGYYGNINVGHRRAKKSVRCGLPAL